MEKRGFTLIELLVVLGFLVLLALFLIPRKLTYDINHNQHLDVNNLKSLCNAYTTGLHVYPSPKATGHRFWLALFVGDKEGTKDGLKIEDAYARPGDASMLRCSHDSAVKTKIKMIREFQDMLDNKKSGWDLLKNDELYTSYAGPKSRLSFSKGEVVGATGSRNGLGFFENGFAIVRGNGSAEYKEYVKLAEEYPDEWSDGENLEEPLWNSTLLRTVLNLGATE